MSKYLDAALALLAALVLMAGCTAVTAAPTVRLNDLRPLPALAYSEHLAASEVLLMAIPAIGSRDETRGFS